MAIWGISDLHLSLHDDPQGLRLSPRWAEHVAKLRENWLQCVKPEDLVLIPGDISMAKKHKSLQPDLRYLHELPGTKALAPGNHDLWWNTLDQVRIMMRDGQLALEGDAVETHGVIVAGARSAPPYCSDSPADQAGLRKGLDSLERALIRGNVLRTEGETLYLLWHHPPFDPRGRPGPAVELIKQFKVDVCVYGHIHAENHWPVARRGRIDGVRYEYVAADAIGFCPLLIAE